MKLIGQKKFSYNIKYSNVPYYYLNGENLDGTFYQEELQKTNLNKDNLYIIEKIIKTRNSKLFVKWRGYSNNYNSWIDKKDIIKYT